MIYKFEPHDFIKILNWLQILLIYNHKCHIESNIFSATEGALIDFVLGVKIFQFYSLKGSAAVIRHD